MLNFRDVAISLGNNAIVPSRLYRSALPNYQTLDALDPQHIAAVVDLRSESEIARTNKFEPKQSSSETDKQGNSILADAALVPVPLKRAALLTSKTQIFLGILSVMTWTQKWSFAKQCLTNFIHRKPVEPIVRAYVSSLGLRGMNRLMLRMSSKGIREAFDYVLVALESNPKHGVVVGCLAGKDRTGLVIAMILECVGVPRKYILQDYAITATRIEQEPYFKKYLIDSLLHAKIDPKEWMKAPEGYLEDTLEYIDEKYGGIASYLRTIGKFNSECFLLAFATVSFPSAPRRKQVLTILNSCIPPTRRIQ